MIESLLGGVILVESLSNLNTFERKKGKDKLGLKWWCSSPFLLKLHYTLINFIKLSFVILCHMLE